MGAPGFELKSIGLQSSCLTMTHASGSAGFRASLCVYSYLQNPTEDVRCSTYCTVGIKPSALVTNFETGITLLNEMGQEPIFFLYH